jgi:hypothetical protein
MREMKLQADAVWEANRDAKVQSDDTAKIATSPMDDNQFWELISAIDQNALANGAEDVALNGLITALSRLPAGEVESFHLTLTDKLYDLDTSAHYEVAGGGDDGFLYTRCYVVALGRESYEDALKDPTKMPSEDQFLWLEGLLFAPSRAWAEITEDDPMNFPDPEKSYETGSNADAWE